MNKATALLTRRVTLADPLVIESPRIAFLNLIGSSAAPLVATDKAVLGPLFAAVESSDHNLPECDVLLLYCQIQDEGNITGTSDGLRDIIRASNAPIVIVASENTGQSYIAADQQSGNEKANLVMTIERKGAAFTRFFSELFTRMFAGESMLLAWVELAPQNPHDPHEDCPATIFAAEVSHIVFRRA